MSGAGRTAMVTGDRGIGAAAGRALAGRGFRDVVGAGANPEVGG